MDRNSMEKLMKGTTTIGIVCSDGVVLGADSRATMDVFIASPDARKVWKIDENIGLTIAGGVGDAQELIRQVRIQNEVYKMEEGKPLSPKAATSLLSIILQDSKFYPYFVQLIVGGVDAKGNPQLYSLDMAGGYQEEQSFTSTGSGSIAALGYIEGAYKKNMSVKDGIRLVNKALSIAMRRDSATGDKILIAVLTKSGYEEYSGKELEKATAVESSKEK
jgi:proteasome beta subunit